MVELPKSSLVVLPRSSAVVLPRSSVVALGVALGVRQQLQRVRAALAAHVARVLAPRAAGAVVPLVAATVY